ncbi:MAG: hypothetical protein GQ527_13385 [Bacteroidales bacterium]|nr:hypothetical protein [Bacteroidales bacterium]
MEDKSNIEILRDFAKSTNRSIVDKEIPHPLTGIHTFRKYRRMIYIPNNPQRTSFFVWFSDPYAKIGLPTVLCGAFIPISSKIKSSINIRNRNTLDKLNIFSKTKTNKIGNDHFDSKVIISGDMDSSMNRFLSPSRFQGQLLKALEIEKYMNISLNEYEIDFVPELKNTPYLSIINPQSWYLEKDDIERVFRQIEKIRNTIY